MCLLQGILVYIRENGRLFLLTGGEQPEGLVYQQVLQAVVREACKTRIDYQQAPGGAEDPKTSNTRPREDPDRLFFSRLCGSYLTILAVRVTPAHPLTTSSGLVSWGSEMSRVQCSAHCDASVLHAHFHQSCAGLWDAGCHCPHRDHPSCYQGLLSWEALPHSLYKVRANADRTLHLQQMLEDMEDRN